MAYNQVYVMGLVSFFKKKFYSSNSKFLNVDA